MIATIVYIMTVIYFGNTVYKYINCAQPCKVTNCFDEGAEGYLGIIMSEEYDYH